MSTLTANQREALAATFSKPDAVTMPCPTCEGTGRRVDRHGQFLAPCSRCTGHGTLTIDPDAIRDACLNSRTGKFRASSPKRPDQGGVYGATFVWRMVRFHTGADMRQPLFIMWDYPRATHDLLHAIADWVAWEVAGERSLTGALRWGRALGYA